MTARDKAIALVRSFSKQMPPKVIPTASTKSGELSCNIDLFANIPRAKQCALIAVDEIESLLHFYVVGHNEREERKFWEDVKTEIEKL
jgi:hypothetical protein